VLVVFLVLFAVVVGRLAQIQVMHRDRLEALGAANVERAIPLPAARGTILDRNGNDLAISLPRRTVMADPRYVDDPVAAATDLARILDLDRDELAVQLARDTTYVYVARQVDDELAARVERAGIPGVYFIDEAARFEPAGDLASALLGSVAVDGTGRAGIELRYDDLLTGEAGRLEFERANGRTIPQGGEEVRPAVAGDDLVLTIDLGMQYATEQALLAQVERIGADGAWAIVSNPRTGEIYAMASVDRGPAAGAGDDASGDAAEGAAADAEPSGAPRISSVNAALTTVYEPGSVNKVITMAGALEEGLVSPTTPMEVPDRLQVSDHVFSDAHDHATETWTPTDILATSSNIGTILLAQQLGAERLDEYLRRFGFGEPTALDLPGESGGLMLDVDDWSGTSIGSIPLGHGVSVTAMQMLSAYNVLANGGEYVEPRLVAATVDAAGVRHDVQPSAEHRVVSELTARQVTDMLVAAVQEGGTGTLAAIDGYTVAGKTGTAKKPQPGGGYVDAAGNTQYVSTFAGFVPAQDPQLSIIVVVDEPSNGYYASQVAAPVFAELAHFGLRQFRVPPPTTPYQSSVPEPTVEPIP
jgi:cell division protein FtsI (penicillin-binding protein 3)